MTSVHLHTSPFLGWPGLSTWNSRLHFESLGARFCVEICWEKVNTTISGPRYFCFHKPGTFQWNVNMVLCPQLLKYNLKVSKSLLFCDVLAILHSKVRSAAPKIEVRVYLQPTDLRLDRSSSDITSCSTRMKQIEQMVGGFCLVGQLLRRCTFSLQFCLERNMTF